MFIYVTYKEPPELSLGHRLSSEELDESVERQLLVNPDCYARVMLEYIRKKCRLAANTNFDLCDENGGLKRLFDLPTFAYVNNLFDHKRNYYLIVMRQETHGDRQLAILPQLNRENRLYVELQTRIRRNTTAEDASPMGDSAAVGKGKKK